jgi:predicted acylesterase/phospholipase RssA
VAQAVQKQRAEKAKGGPARPARNVLCLSGGGAYGAYSAGLLCGWTCRGDRPEFDVVTGISTGALIAPLAFLGPRYDGEMKRFYTTLENRDVYRLKPVRGLVSESLADNSPLADKGEGMLTPEVLAEVAAEHRKGRRLYVGTTEAESKRFVVWDLGAIACRGTPQDRELVKNVLLGSSAIPGFFPPAKITVDVDGRCFTERHVDGGVSQSLFFCPPYLSADQRSDSSARDLAGTNVYVVVAGKLYADPEAMRPRALSLATKNMVTVLYAQTRGDLQRLYTACLLTGMNYRLASIPAEFPAPASSTEFEREAMTRMFDEGAHQISSGSAWRDTPPLLGLGESILARSGTNLTHRPQGPPMPARTGR